MHVFACVCVRANVCRPTHLQLERYRRLRASTLLSRAKSMSAVCVCVCVHCARARILLVTQSMDECMCKKRNISKGLTQTQVGGMHMRHIYGDRHPNRVHSRIPKRRCPNRMHSRIPKRRCPNHSHIPKRAGALTACAHAYLNTDALTACTHAYLSADGRHAHATCRAC